MQRRLSAPDIDFDAIRAELGLSEEYGDKALAEAQAATDRNAEDREDRTDLALVTIDPPGAMDLDQALHIGRDGSGDGFVINYAIADVAALVEPEGALDAESRRRGSTVYLPDGSVPLHPRELSEGAGSLLPEQVRPCVLWTITVDAAGEVGEVQVRRATVRCVARFDYAGVMADADAGNLHESIALLPEFGELRQRVALARGAVELDLPDQEAVRDDDGWRLRVAPHTRADTWNAQVSLLTGMCAGKIMREAGIGLLRTLPPAPDDAVENLRRVAATFNIAWPEGATPGEFLATLPAAEPTTLALMSHAATLMRGANYLALEGQSVTDGDTYHGGIGGVYAHVTAPLRRLGDRFATEVCLAVTAGREVPEWVRRALPTLPKILRSADSLAATANRMSIDLTEAVVLADRVGETFEAVVLRAAVGERPAQIFIESEAVIAGCLGAPEQAARLTVELTTADSQGRLVEFTAR